MICQLAGPTGTKARKASVERPDAQIEAFDVAGANLVHVRLARNRFEFDARAFGRRITAFNNVEPVPSHQGIKTILPIYTPAKTKPSNSNLLLQSFSINAICNAIDPF